MAELLAVEREFCESNREDLLATYHGHYLLVHGTEVHGDFETREEAVVRGVELFGAGPFLVWSPLETEKDLHLSIPALAIGVPLTCQS